MSAATGTLGGAVASAIRMQVPDWGRFWADVDLVGPDEISGVTTLQIADVTATVAVVSGRAVNGRASYRVVGGAGGWGRSLARKGYSNDAGVKLSTVIQDAANACGETVEDMPAGRMGPHFVRPAGLASAVLNAVAERGWRVDFDGVTRFGARASSAYAGDGVRTRIDPAGAIVEIETNALAALVPGVTIDGSAPATDVEYLLSADRLVARVYAGPRKSRRLDAIARILDVTDPRRRYRGVFEFRVVLQVGHRLSLQPVRSATGLPDLANVPIRPGIMGLRGTVLPGSLVLVSFVDSDPSRPVVTGFDAPDAPGFALVPATFPVAYQGSAVVGGFVTDGSTILEVQL